MNQYTVGDWDDEKQAGDAFDLAISNDPRFSSVYREVKGIYSAKSPHDLPPEPRIDRVLIPSKKLRNAGWLHGPIGVEIKAPGNKIGAAVAQCIDYSHAQFEVMPGFHMSMGFIFLFACRPTRGDLDSIMVQNRIGTANVTPLNELVFFRGSRKVVSIEEPDRNFITFRKVGSR